MQTNNSFQIKTTDNIAIVPNIGIGDGLVFMVFAYNLYKNGFHNVTIYSNLMYQLKSFFPYAHIEPISETKQQFIAIANSYNKIISANGSRLLDYTKENQTDYLVLHDKLLDKRISIVKNITQKLEKILPDANIVDSNGIEKPTNLTHRKFIKRIVIHALSRDEGKNWPLHKFIKLATKLENKGYSPVFILAPDERITWNQATNTHHKTFSADNLQAVAEFIYESGWMIGNDSGIGHLASALGIPSMTIFSRNSIKKLWQPYWTYNIAITFPLRLPRKIRGIWKQLLSVKKVLASFQELTNKYHNK